MKIREIKDITSMLQYFGEYLDWNITFDDDIDIDDLSFQYYAEDLNIKPEEFAKIAELRQIRPFADNMPFGIFSVNFESKRLEVAALKKILSKLASDRKDNPDLPAWNKNELIFLCFWGEEGNEFIGAACFDDNDKNLPQLKNEYIQPACEDTQQILQFETKISHLKMPEDTEDTEAWRNNWHKAFTKVYKKQITDSKNLAVELAELARKTRDTIIDTYSVETGFGYVHLLYKKFKDNLIHDLDVEQFADMYAQTIAYGLFTAKCMSDSNDFKWQDAVDNIPNTNPFLKTLIKGCFEHDNVSFFDELDLAEIVSLLDNTDIEGIVEHFNRHTGGGREDTVIYFYEDFLSAYEHDTKKRRGVYYTPYPVVKFMVNAVDDILRNEFGIEYGLADTEMTKVSYLRENMKKRGEIKEDVKDDHRVQILDPATGTGTFLREVILKIHDTFTERHKGKSEEEIRRLWNEYVPNHLLPRINGFELMMAPYAVAHMKLAMVLKDTGYEFGSDERLRVMLTNSLEPSKKDYYEDYQQFSMFEDPLAAESYEADKTKVNRGINVIIGNPPYNGSSVNDSEWISKLMEDYKKEPGGKKSLMKLKIILTMIILSL